MEMKLPEAWSPLANTLPAFKEVHRNGQHKGICSICFLSTSDHNLQKKQTVPYSDLPK